MEVGTVDAQSRRVWSVDRDKQSKGCGIKDPSRERERPVTLKCIELGSIKGAITGRGGDMVYKQHSCIHHLSPSMNYPEQLSANRNRIPNIPFKLHLDALLATFFINFSRKCCLVALFHSTRSSCRRVVPREQIVPSTPVNTSRSKLPTCS